MTGLCNAAWNSITFLPNGKIIPCNQFDYTQGLSIREFRGHNTFKHIQHEMLQGHTPAGCRMCSSEYQAKFGTDPSRRTSIRFLDLRNTNFCNYACRFCGPEASSRIDQAINGGPHVAIRANVNPYLEHIVSPDLEEIYFTGGEPMLNLDHWNVLDCAIDKDMASDIFLRYSSNLSTLKFRHRHVRDYWPKFKQVELHVSLDAIGPTLEIIRRGARWSIIERNLQELFNLAMPNVDIVVACTVSALNVWFLEPLVQYCQDRNIRLHMDLLRDPDILAVNSLPLELREKARDQLISIGADHLIGEIDFKNPEDLFVHFVAHVLLLDRIHQDNLYDLLPIDSMVRQRVLTY